MKNSISRRPSSQFLLLTDNLEGFSEAAKMESLFQPMTPSHHLHFTPAPSTTTTITKASSKLNTPEACPLVNLSRDVQLSIFQYLDPGTSAVLGITCKPLYKMHRALHGSVPLNTRIWFDDAWGHYYYSLGHYLAAWADRDIHYLDYDYQGGGGCRFVKWPKQKTSAWLADNASVTWHRMKKKVLLKLKGGQKRLKVVAQVEWEVASEERASRDDVAVFEWDTDVCTLVLA